MDTKTFIDKYAITRKGTDSLKWDALKERFGSDELLPLWVADADFSTDQAVKDALVKRVDEGAYGYSIRSADYVASYQGWQDRHEGTQVKAEWLIFSTGVVQSLYDLIACFTNEEDGIMIQTPVYYPFFNSVKDQNRRLVEAPLLNDDEDYTMDLVKMEELFKTQNIQLFILCSPHNPIGRVWTKDELKAVVRLCQTYNVRLLSDEIHSDLVVHNHTFVSALTVAKEVGFRDLIVCNSPSKTFNFAGLLHSHIWIPDEALRTQFQKWAKQHRQTEISVLGQVAAKTAYQSSDEWHQAFLQVIEENYLFIKSTLQEALPEITISPLQGTYLAWLNIESVLAGESVKEFIQEKAKLAIDYGEWFSPAYKHYIRINLATTPDIIKQALKQFILAAKQ